MSVLREAVRLRDEPASPRTAASPGDQSAVPVLRADVHAEQHGQTAHCTGAQNRAHSEGPPEVEPVTASSSSLSLSSSSSSLLSSWLSLSSSMLPRR